MLTDVRDQRCGTYAGYKAHLRRGDQPCEFCRQANAARSRMWARETGHKRPPRPQTEARRAYSRAYMAARTRALTRLAQEYPEQFRQFLLEERAKQTSQKDPETS
jgi:hypothetical protein